MTDNNTPPSHEEMCEALLEDCSEAAHNEWLAEKRRRGVTTWPNERGFEQMIPYADCPEDVKEFDRIVVGAIMRVLEARGLAQLEASRLGKQWRHQKRGTTYRIEEPVTIQCETPIQDGEQLVAYRADIDGALWARRPAEFYDGRFERVAPPATTSEGSEP